MVDKYSKKNYSKMLSIEDAILDEDFQRRATTSFAFPRILSGIEESMAI